MRNNVKDLHQSKNIIDIEILDDFAEWVDAQVSDGWIIKKLVENYKKEKSLENNQL
jgi:hypothetical protein